MRRPAQYSPEPEDGEAFTRRFNRRYTRVARAYDVAVTSLPTWRRWLAHSLPHIRGPRVLEVSPGTGWLLTRYAASYEVHAIDLNQRLVEIARSNLRRAGVNVDLRVGDVQALPYADGSFDTVLNTMAFSGYPDGRRALSEMVRVLRPGGRLIIIDVNYPCDGNPAGSALVELWKYSGDLIRDVRTLLADHGLSVVESEIGGFGSVHLYLATTPG